MSLNALLLLPMLATAPYALIDTREIPKADIKQFQVYIRAIDGKAYWDGPEEMKVSPGVHWIVMTREKSPKSKTRKDGEQSLYIMAKPCTRYYVAGGGEGDAIVNPDPKFNQSWRVQVRKVEPILDCKTKEQLDQEKLDKKAKAKQKSSEPQDSQPAAITEAKAGT